MVTTLLGPRVSSSTVPKLNQKVYGHIERWRTQPIEGGFTDVYLGGLVLKPSWGGELKNVPVSAAVGIDVYGYWRILDVCEGHKEEMAGWLGFLEHLEYRGPSSVRLLVSDACLALREAIDEVCPDGERRRCGGHF